MADRYYGWRNYETWAVSLWLGNDEETDAYWHEVALEVFENVEPTRGLTRGEAAHVELAARLQDEVEENNPCLDGGLYADLLDAALSEVDWREIAAFYLDDLEQVEREEPLG